jgi:hypothetical protein
MPPPSRFSDVPVCETVDRRRLGLRWQAGRQANVEWSQCAARKNRSADTELRESRPQKSASILILHPSLPPIFASRLFAIRLLVRHSQISLRGHIDVRKRVAAAGAGVSCSSTASAIAAFLYMQMVALFQQIPIR